VTWRGVHSAGAAFNTLQYHFDGAAFIKAMIVAPLRK
jgi:hypothetical protein